MTSVKAGEEENEIIFNFESRGCVYGDNLIKLYFVFAQKKLQCFPRACIIKLFTAVI